MLPATSGARGVGPAPGQGHAMSGGPQRLSRPGSRGRERGSTHAVCCRGKGCHGWDACGAPHEATEAGPRACAQ